MDKLSFKQNQLINEGGKKYIYIMEDNRIFEVDDNSLAVINEKVSQYELLSEQTKMSMGEKEFKQIIADMRSAKFIKEDDENKVEPIVEVSEIGDIRMLTLLLIQGCNLRCRYCYGEDGQYNDSGVMSLETAKQAIDFLMSKSKSENVTVCLFGGEPLLKFDLIKEIVAYSKEVEKTSGKKIHFTMTTNGTLINKEIEDFIIENKIQVQISIDGDEKTHDANRYFADKSGCHATVLEHTAKIRKLGLADARATVTGQNLDLISIYKYLKDLGFRKVALSPAFNLLSDEEYEALADAYIQFYLDLEKAIKNKDYNKALENKLFMQEIRQVNQSRHRRLACGVGRNLYAVDIHGNIFPCQRFVAEKEYSLGNVYTGDKKQNEFVQNVMLDKYEKCQGCWARNLCVAGCANQNLVLTGNINEPYEPFCNYVRKAKQEILHIYLRLTEEEKAILFKSKKKES